MDLTFIPGQDSPWRVISADSPQPEESWSPNAPNKRIAPGVAPTAQADAPPPTVAHLDSVLPAAPPADPCVTQAPADSSPAGTGDPDFLLALARIARIALSSLRLDYRPTITAPCFSVPSNAKQPRMPASLNSKPTSGFSNNASMAKKA